MFSSFSTLHTNYFVTFSSFSVIGSYNQPKFSVCATRNPDAITFVDNSTLDLDPVNVFVSGDNTLYVVSKFFSSVYVWSKGSNTMTRNISNNLKNPQAVCATSNGNIYVAYNDGNGTIQKWSNDGTSSLVFRNIGSGCFSLFIDINGILYCSLDIQHQVVTLPLSSISSGVTIASGNGSAGATANTLHFPNGIFVSRKLNLYVADCGNDRIQLFQAGQVNGTTVVGATAPWTMTLSCPYAVILDADDDMFIADADKRIIRSGLAGTQCVLGCTGLFGSASNQLNKPHSLSFDSLGNLFVADLNNARIQKFLLSTNTCGEYSHHV